MKIRCEWAGNDPLYVDYHDRDWGLPVHDDRMLFEMLILEGAQAGLAWITILRKREGYRRAFKGFDPALVARYGPADEARLLQDAGIVRNRLKVSAAIGNARAFRELQARHGSFDSWIWRYVEGQTIQNTWRSMADVPASTELSERISMDLRRLGFKFVGPTIVYAYMQSIGMVNDHVVDCFRHVELGGG
jgi:DNA-3-methyladenine glycosylase I